MAGPDLYLELDESILNEALASGWQAGLANYAGKLTFVDKAPLSLAAYAEVAFRIILNGEPLIDLRKPKQVFIHCDARLELLVLTMVPLTFDLAFHVETEVTLKASQKKICFKPVEVVIDRLAIRDAIKVSDAFLHTLNTMLAAALMTYVGSDELTKTLATLSIDVLLPLLADRPENQLPLVLSDCVILDQKRLALGVTFLTGSAPEIPSIPAASEMPVFISLRQQAMRDVLDFWWSRVDWSEPILFDGEMPLNASAFVKQARSLLTRLVSLGFVQREEDISNLVLTYAGQIHLLSKPELLFTAPATAGLGQFGLKVALNVRIAADVNKRLSLDTSGVIPDAWTPWPDDIQFLETSSKQEILHLQQTVELSLQAVKAALTVRPDGSLALQAQKADLALELGNEWYQNLPENLLNGLLKFFSQKIIDHLPPLAISPAVVLKNVRVAGLTPIVTPSQFQVCEAGAGLYGEATVAFATGFDVAELTGKVHVPGYIANRRSHRIHRVTCPVIQDIRPEHREGYFVLHEALRDGYQACQECLRGAVIL